MTGRSLRASPQGIKQAKKTLDNKSLTQKAIAEELEIASWSTVNKFFTGKPVDRKVFIAICEALNLEWEDIVSLKPQLGGEEEPRKNAESPHPSDELAVIQHNASRTRRALEPYILPRIRRDTLLDNNHSSSDAALKRNQKSSQLLVLLDMVKAPSSAISMMSY